MTSLGAYQPSKKAFTGGNPQMKTNTVRIAHGVQARITAERECSVGAAFGTTAVSSCGRPLSETDRQMRLGCQTRRNATRLNIDTTAAITSTSSGPM